MRLGEGGDDFLGEGGADIGVRIFQGEAAPRLEAEAAGRLEINVGGGLAGGDFIAADEDGKKLL